MFFTKLRENFPWWEEKIWGHFFPRKIQVLQSWVGGGNTEKWMKRQLGKPNYWIADLFFLHAVFFPFYFRHWLHGFLFVAKYVGFWMLHLWWIPYSTPFLSASRAPTAMFSSTQPICSQSFSIRTLASFSVLKSLSEPDMVVSQCQNKLVTNLWFWWCSVALFCFSIYAFKIVLM